MNFTFEKYSLILMDKLNVNNGRSSLANAHHIQQQQQQQHGTANSNHGINNRQGRPNPNSANQHQQQHYNQQQQPGQQQPRQRVPQNSNPPQQQRGPSQIQRQHPSQNVSMHLM